MVEEHYETKCLANAIVITAYVPRLNRCTRFACAPELDHQKVICLFTLD